MLQNKEKKKPEIFFKTITFNDGTKIPLKRNSIVVFTGANNSGKSQLLKDIENSLNSSNHSSTIIVRNTECDFGGEIDNPEFINENFFINENGYYQQFGKYMALSMDSLKYMWKNQKLTNDVHSLFVKRLGTELRLQVSNALDRNHQPEQHPIYKMINDNDLEQRLSVYFFQAFGLDLVVNRNEIKTIPLHVGMAPVKQSYTMDKQDDYYKQVCKLPKLQEQGDGMRSFVSILLDTFISNHSVSLIDEPEAFLHPPQARVLGKMLAKNNPCERQLFISTHSEDFLQGLLDADNKNVIVIRINRIENINKMSVLQNEQIKLLWGNPILRYSNILSGLFHEKVVVCESDYDCLFYQAIIDAIYEKDGEIAPDILFVHCGGKHRVKDIVAALKAINVPVVSICDFDLLNSKPTFKGVVDAYGIDWQRDFELDMKTIYDGMNAKPNAWENIKKIGKAGFSGNEPAAYEKIENKCKKMGLFIIPVGEIECFVKTVNKEKKDWVYFILENFDLANDIKLDEARKFVKEIVDYKTT